MGVSLPELLSSLSNYCLTRRRAQCSPHIKLQHPPTVAPTPWLNSKTAPSQRTEITASHTHAQPQPTLPKILEIVGQGVMGRRLEEVGGGSAHPDSGPYLGADLL